MRDYYRRIHAEGLVFSAKLGPIRYEMNEAFDPEWGDDSVSWAAGGEELYSFDGGERVTLKSGGVLTVARADRYHFEVRGPKPHRSNMIVFSDDLARRIAASVSADAYLSDETDTPKARPVLLTALARPGAEAALLMQQVERACRSGGQDSDWFEERAALLYAALLKDQQKLQAARDNLDVAKQSTRTELQRRAAFAVCYMHECYADSSLSLAAIAREARLSRFHFVRVFKAIYGATPVEYLTEVRLDAAARLLAETPAPISEIAVQTGFSDRTAFFRRFRRRYGVSPSGFRGGASSSGKYI